MHIEIGSYEAKTKLPELLRGVQVGNRYTITLRGAAVAGMLLGLAENLCLAVIDPQWSEAVTFVILFLFILFRPGGVYGRAVVS